VNIIVVEIYIRYNAPQYFEPRTYNNCVCSVDTFGFGANVYEVNIKR
jgi:hypothetical protein